MIEDVQQKTSMIFPDYQFDKDELFSWLKANDFDSIALQVPEGLKRQALDLIKSIETELGIAVVLVADPCYGACDVDDAKLESLGVKALIHIGHSQIPNRKHKIPIKYIELQSTINVAELIQNAKNLNILKSEFKPPCALGLLTNIQFITQIDKVINILETVKYQVWVGTGDDRIKHPGQVLGCNFSAARAIDDKVKGFLFIGDGMFHPLGVALATNKRVLTYNPVDNKFQETAELRDKILRQRSGAISSLKDAINFGILVSTKSGQNRMELAKKIQNKLKLNDRNGALLTLDTITPTQVDYLPFDGYISTACPRLAIDDFIQYKKPIITPIELEIILGERSWENYAFDEIIE